MAVFDYEAEIQWTDSGTVSLLLDLPLAPQEIQSLELRRLPHTIIHCDSAENLSVAFQNAYGWHRYQIEDEGPFEGYGTSEQVAYEVIIHLADGGLIQLSDPTRLEPLLLSSRPFLSTLRVRQAWPNPANPRTSLEYSVTPGETFGLTIRDLRGRLVRRLLQGRGTGEWTNTTWDGNDDHGRALPSGLYFFDLRTEDRLEVRKVILAR